MLMTSTMNQVLNLDFCTLSKLPASLGQLTELTSLDVEGNLFLGDTYRAEPSSEAEPSFAEELAGLQSLRYLNLNSCGLTSVPPVRPTLLLNARKRC